MNAIGVSYWCYVVLGGGVKGDWGEAWKDELDDFVRAFSGAFLFGVPFLWTMEMWWIGTYAELWKLLLFLGLSFLLNMHLAYFTGFKEKTTFRSSVGEAVDAMAVGVVSSAVVLFALNRIGPGRPLDSMLGMIVIQAIPLSIGASAANALLRWGKESRTGEEASDETEASGETGSDESERESRWRATLNDFGATVVGGVFIGFSIAPTDEVSMLAAQIGPWHELGLILLSLVMTYAIVFESGFTSREREVESPGYLQRPLTETVVAYLLSLLVALVALYFFDRIEIGDPFYAVLSQVVVLGFPTAIGGAAGRIVV